MLFNSYEFILAFLPATIVVFLILGSFSRNLALSWVILASIGFYAWWRPLNVAIIAPSIAVNYLAALALARLSGDPARKMLSSIVLAAGIVFNIAFLGYFKYANFLVSAANDVGTTNFVLEQIILPLGISFITFQKIAFLVDVAGGRQKTFTLRDYLLFVLFFPQLIAGPIIHYRETIPQFERATCRFDAQAYAVGVALFCFGLFKKVVLADGIAPHVSPVFEYAAAGGAVTLLQAWFAAVGFTLQIYFDFSGYSDMACGAALFFGVRLPLNFDSPLRATSIIDFWARWHVTLTRFLTAYVYNPLVLAQSRARARKGKPPLRIRGSRLSAFLLVLAGPTLFTMFVSGVWHGAGYTFILWGLLHGAYLVVNHAARQYGRRRKVEAGWLASNAGALGGWALTFLAVVVAMVLFRAPSLAAAGEMFGGMVGAHGVGLPRTAAEILGMPQLGPMMVGKGEVWLRDFIVGAAMLGALLAIALLAPNSLQVLSRQEPVLDPPQRPPRLAILGPAVYWKPNLPWLLFIAAIGAAGMIRLTGQSEFLYWQF